jgi:hypothetical protein
MIAFRANLPDALRRATQEAVRLTRDTGTRYAVTFEPGLLAPHRRASAAYVVAAH